MTSKVYRYWFLSWLIVVVVLDLLSYRSNQFIGAAVFDENSPMIPSSTFRMKTSNNNNNNNLEFQMANDESFGFFDDISSREWKLLQEIAVKSYEPHLDSGNPLKFADNLRRGKSPSFYQTNYEPNFSCRFEQRVGGNGNGDGPKWVCDPHRIRRQQHNTCLVYSVGSNGDFQFETALQRLLGPGVCEIHIFDIDDYTQEMKMAESQYNVSGLHFHSWGIFPSFAKSNSTFSSLIPARKGVDIDRNKNHHPHPQHTYKSLQETVKILGHEQRDAIDIFKIDCESCEWDTVNDWFDPSVPRLQQILVELHRSPPKKVLQFFNTLLEHGYVTFHKEPNIQHSQGNCIEYSFLKLKSSFFA